MEKRSISDGLMEILIIFFGIHTANVVQLARRIAKAELCQAA